MKKIFVNLLVIILFLSFSKSLIAQSSSEIVTLTKTEFLNQIYDYTVTNATYHGKLPAIVEFYADYCRPCKEMEPYLKELMKEYRGKIEIYKVDLIKERELMRDLNITSIPLFFFFPLQGEPKLALGYQTKEELRELIEEELKP